MSEVESLATAVTQRRGWIWEYLERHPSSGLQSVPLQDGVLEYLRRGGKHLRGAVCLLSCGLMGSDEKDALAAACAVEVFHAWTLVHDDIIDRDNTRRGGPTLHRYFEKQARNHDAPWYGLSMSLLAGDIQQAWATELLCKLDRSPDLILHLIRELCGQAVPQLIEGEALDIELSGTPFSEIRQDDILQMIDKKTAVLYRFAGRAGAWVGQRSAEATPEVEILADFLTDIGVAFQLRDDVLGVTSSKEVTGKDSDSDIREGKRTLIAALAYDRTDDRGRALLDATLGKAGASLEEIQAVRDLFAKTEAIGEVERMAQEKVDRALQNLERLPSRPQRELLHQLALFLVQRQH